MARRPTSSTDGPDRSATYRQVFASREYRFLTGALAVSLLGDQALRVGLSLLIYHDTHSALLTAVAYALTFLPWVIGGPLLSGVADRAPRRTVIVGGNVARAVIVGLMVIPHVPVAVLLLLVCAAETLAPPVDAAQFSLLPDVLDGDRYVVALSLNQAIVQSSQIIGFGLGGTLVALVGARACFGIDAMSFLLAAALVAMGVGRYPPVSDPETGTSFWADTREGFRIALGRTEPRTLLLMAWWGAAILLVPEALAAPFVARITHGGATATGWLLSAQPLGMVIGLLVLGRFVRPSQRPRLMRPLAVAGCCPLIVFVVRPTLAGAILLLLVSGIAWSYQVPLQSEFVRAIPGDARGRAFGVAAGGLQVAQGIGILIGGGLAQAFGVTAAITSVGIVGALVMLGLTLIRVPAPSPAPPLVEAAATS